MAIFICRMLKAFLICPGKKTGQVFSSDHENKEYKEKVLNKNSYFVMDATNK